MPLLEGEILEETGLESSVALGDTGESSEELVLGLERRRLPADRDCGALVPFSVPL